MGHIAKVIQGILRLFKRGGNPLATPSQGITDEEGVEKTTDGEALEIYDPDKIFIKFRAKPGDTPVDVQHDFDHIPGVDEIEDTFGSGYFNIYAGVGEKTPKLKKRFNIEGYPIYPVKEYEIKVRVTDGGKLLDPDVSFPGPNIPEKDEIVRAIGGGGIVKITAKDKEGKAVWVKWEDYKDSPPSLELIKKDDTTKSKIEAKLEERKKAAEDDLLRGLSSGGSDNAPDKFTSAINRICGVIEDKKLDKLEKTLTDFANKLGSPEINTTNTIGGKDKGFSELAFKEPYVIKLETQKKIIEELAKSDPHAALKELKQMPDGITIALKLALAGTGLLEGFTDIIKDQHEEKREKRTEKKGGAEEKKKDVKKDIESGVNVVEKEVEGGFELDFKVGG